MAWTAPRTWVAGETVTAALMNTHVRDNLKAAGDPWTTYTPTLVNMTIGSGTLIGKYAAIGKLIILSVYLAAGGTTAYTGAVTVSLPFGAAPSREQVGSLKLFTGAGDFVGAATIGSGASVTIPRVPTSSANNTLVNMSNTSPNTSTTGNLSIQLTYEAA